MQPIRRRPIRRGSVLAAALLVTMLAGCAANSGLVNMWKDPAGPSTPLRSMYVVAMKKDAANRRIMEDAFVSALAKRHVSATPSYREFPAALPDSNQIENTVHSGGYDGVLIASRLDTQTHDTYIPGYVTTQPVTAWNPWAGRYVTRWRDIETPGYVETNEIVRHQVDVWSTANGGQMVWTATGNSINPSSSEDVTKHLVNEVIDELSDHGVVPTR